MMKRIRFGIAGTGRISDWVLKGAVLDPRFEAAAVCSRTEEKGREFAARHGIPKVYTDIGAMASDPDLDAVYIGTPNSTHHDLAIRCLTRGKHVLCEKPMASNAREVKEMAAAAKESGVLLMEAMISTLNPNFMVAAERLKSLGKVRHYSAAFCQYSSKYDLLKRIIAGEDASELPSSFNPDRSGGALMDIGIYPIYPMVSLFGRPESIRADIKTCLVPAGGQMKPVDLQGCALFEYPGMNATVTYSKIADSRLCTEISCDGGILTLDQIHITRSVGLTLRGAPTSGRAAGPRTEDISVPQDADEYLCEFREFIDVLESGRRESSVNSLETSLVTAEIMDDLRRGAGVIFPAD